LGENRTDISEVEEALLREKDVMAVEDIISIWPKILEYTGLSKNEAKVYLCLVGLGNSSARKLSLFCDIPWTNVYGILKKLIYYGYVLEIPGTPKCFVPISPKNAFGTILNMMKNKTKDFSSIVQMLDETYKAVKIESVPQGKIVWYFDQDRDIMRKCKAIISLSKNLVTILASADGLSKLFNYTHKLLDELHEHGVEVKLYSPLDPKTSPLARELSYLFDVRKVEITTPVLFIDSDHKRFLIAKIAKHEEDKIMESAIFSDDPTLLSMISLLLMNDKKDLPKTILI
jgi:sugar-specific transcriptional regulator TrmB